MNSDHITCTFCYDVSVNAKLVRVCKLPEGQDVGALGVRCDYYTGMIEICYVYKLKCNFKKIQ